MTSPEIKANIGDSVYIIHLNQDGMNYEIIKREITGIFIERRRVTYEIDSGFYGEKEFNDLIFSFEVAKSKILDHENQRHMRSLEIINALKEK